MAPAGLVIFTAICGIGRPTDSARSAMESPATVLAMIDPHSVCPYTLRTLTPNMSCSVRTRSGAATEPPTRSTRSEPASRGRARWRPMRSKNIVGTPKMAATPSSGIRSRTRSGSKRRSGTRHTPAARAVRLASTAPPTWNMGVGLRNTSPGPSPRRCALKRMLFVTPRWCSMAALGRPVVPEVKWIWARSSGRTSGSTASPPASGGAHCAQVASGSRSRRTGKPGATASSQRAIGLPWCSSARQMPAACDCRST